MALLQNQFKLSTLKGTKVFGHEDNVMSVQFYSATNTDTLAPGEFVLLDSSTPAGSVPRVVKGSALTDAYFGVVLTNPIQETFAVGDYLEIGVLSSVVVLEASAAINVGASLQYAPTTGKVATKTASNTVVATALEKAAADGDLIRAFIRS
jgi:hypothetical protein